MNSSNMSVAKGAFAITPSNSTNLATRARAIYVGIGGDITLVGADGVVATFVGVPQGSILPVEATRVNLTGTSAGSLVGLA